VLYSLDPDKSGDLAVWILSKLLLTLTRFVAGVVEPSISGLSDLELPELDALSATELWEVEIEPLRDWWRDCPRINHAGRTPT
jgi:hypothetical protein